VIKIAEYECTKNGLCRNYEDADELVSFGSEASKLGYGFDSRRPLHEPYESGVCRFWA